METFYIITVRILGALIAICGALILVSMSQLPLASVDDIFTAIMGALLFAIPGMAGGVALIYHARSIVTQ